jgi:hypothetical protein
VIYFIGNDRGQVKIGYSLRPFERLKILQVSSPDKLEILALKPGDKNAERCFHEKYCNYRLEGEWFEDNKNLSIEMQALRSCYKIDPMSTDNNIILQDRFEACLHETSEIEAKYEPLISKLEAEIEELEKQRDKKIDEIDNKYLY